MKYRLDVSALLNERIFSHFISSAVVASGAQKRSTRQGIFIKAQLTNK